MFDDDKPVQGGGQVPTNLPTSNPDDMFAEVDGGDNLSVEEKLPSALGAGVLKPKSEEKLAEELPLVPVGAVPPMTQEIPSQPVPPSPFSTSYPQSQMSVPNQNDFGNNPVPDNQYGQISTNSGQTQNNITVPPPTMQSGYGNENSDYQLSEPLGKRSMITWLIVFIFFVILGGGSAWVYLAFIKDSGDNIDVQNIEQTDEKTEVVSDENDLNIDNNAVSDVKDMTQEDLNDDILFGKDVNDTDDDGLDDIVEEQLGTDPLNWDSDGDGLSDFDEVEVWKTDPLNSDSDFDTYSDSVEIKNGYNPLGEGKLFDVPTASEATVADEVVVDEIGEVMENNDIKDDGNVVTE